MLHKLREAAKEMRKHTNSHGESEVLVFSPRIKNGPLVTNFIGNIRQPTEREIEILRENGYSMREENRPPTGVIVLNGSLLPVWVFNEVYLSLNISLVKSNMVIKRKLDDIDHIRVREIQNRIKKKKDAGMYAGELDLTLAAAKQTTFRDNLSEMIHLKKWIKSQSILGRLGVAQSVADALDKSTWFLLTNVLEDPQYLSASFKIERADGKREYGKVRIRHGLSIFFCGDQDRKLGSYVQKWAEAAEKKGMAFGRWHLFDREPGPDREPYGS